MLIGMVVKAKYCRCLLSMVVETDVCCIGDRER